MHPLVLGMAARMRTFAPLAVPAAAGPTGPADPPQLVSASPFRPADGPDADAAGGTVTETITSAYRTGR
jgi:hypothetical protein